MDKAPTVLQRIRYTLKRTLSLAGHPIDAPELDEKMSPEDIASRAVHGAVEEAVNRRREADIDAAIASIQRHQHDLYGSITGTVEAAVAPPRQDMFDALGYGQLSKTIGSPPVSGVNVNDLGPSYIRPQERGLGISQPAFRLDNIRDVYGIPGGGNLSTAERHVSVMVRDMIHQNDPDHPAKESAAGYQEGYEYVTIPGEATTLRFVPQPDITMHEYYVCQKALRGMVRGVMLLYLANNGVMRHFVETDPCEVEPLREILAPFNIVWVRP